jgi:hypothetical protein
VCVCGRRVESTVQRMNEETLGKPLS